MGVFFLLVLPCQLFLCQFFTCLPRHIHSILISPYISKTYIYNILAGLLINMHLQLTILSIIIITHSNIFNPRQLPRVCYYMMIITSVKAHRRIYMLVYDANANSGSTAGFECTYTTFKSDNSTASQRTQSLVLDNSEKR